MITFIIIYSSLYTAKLKPTKIPQDIFKAYFILLTSVISLDAAAALRWRLGSFEELPESRARAKVPIDLNGLQVMIR